MNAIPIDYAKQMSLDYFQLQPSWVKGRYNAETEVERRYLYTKLYSIYDFTLPKDWPLNFFRFFLFTFGSLAAIYTKERGWIVYPYGVSKVDMYYQPREIIVFNQFLGSSKKGIIGLNAEIIRVMDDYFGLDDLVTKYAVKLANIDKSVDINLMNANVGLFAEASNKKDAEDIKTAYAEATTGKPMVLLNKELLKGGQLKTLIQNPKVNFLSLEMLQARRDIVNMFLTDIGIRTANYEKRAQISEKEVTQRDGETRAICTVILDTIRECFDKLNSISGLGLEVRFNEEVMENNKSNVSMATAP